MNMEDDEDLIEKELQKDQKTQMRTFFAVVLMVVDFSIIAGSLVVLLINSNDCEEPLRLWFIILSSLLAFHSLFLLSTEILTVGFRQKPGVGSVYFAINTLVHSFLFLWMLVGVVWAYNDSSECKDDYYEGWLLATIIFGIYFGIFAIIFLGLIVITCVTCIGSWHISYYMNKEV